MNTINFNQLHRKVLQKLNKAEAKPTKQINTEIYDLDLSKDFRSYPHLRDQPYIQKPMNLFMMHQAQESSDEAEEEIKYPEDLRKKWYKAILIANLHSDFFNSDIEKKRLSNEVLQEINPKIDELDQYSTSNKNADIDKKELKLKELFVLAIHRLYPENRDYYINRLPKLANEPDWTGDYFKRIEREAKRKNFINIKLTYGINEEGVALAVRNNDQKALNLIFKYAVPENNPLIWAVKHKLTNMVSYILERGDNVNALDTEGLSALNHAAINQAHDIFNLLQEYGAKLDFNNNQSNRIFIRYASQNPNISNHNFANEFYEEINKQNINWNRINSNGTALIHEISANGSIEELKKALELGANINLKAEGGLTPIMFAIASYNIPVLAKLLELGAAVNAIDNEGSSAIHYIGEYAHDNRALDLILKHNANIYSTNNAGQTAIHIAAEVDNSEIIKSLAERGIAINASCGNSKMTAVHIATQQNNMKSLSKLLELGADPNLRTSDFGYTPLIYAIKSSNIAAVDILLNMGADINLTSTTGNLPITIALVDKEYELIIKLLKAGARPDATDKNQQNSLHVLAQYSSEEDFIDIIKYLQKQNNSDEPLTYINKQDSSGKTALHFTVASMGAEAVASLIDAGAEINIRDNDGATPIHHASMLGNNEALDELVFSFGNPMLKNKNRQTAKDVALDEGTSQTLYKLGG